MRAVLIALVLLSGVVLAQSNPLTDNKPNHAANTNNQPYSDQRGTEKNPFIVKTLGTDQANNGTAQENPDKLEHLHNEWIAAYSTFAIATLTAILAIATGVLAIFTYNLWTATRKLVIDSSDTAKKELRAYVGVHQVGVKGLEDDGPIGVGFAFINYGQTPAQNFNLIGTIDLLPFPLPEGTKLQVAPERARQDGVIFPKESNPMIGWVWQRTIITRAEKTALLAENPTRVIYAHGVATYTDIFDRARQTEFCFYLNPASIVRNMSGQIVRDKDRNIQYQWAPCAGYNKIH
jgi:hypothetical protein